jgi:hypothetical protein
MKAWESQLVKFEAGEYIINPFSIQLENLAVER